MWVAAASLIVILAAAVLAFVPALEFDDLLWPLGGVLALIGFVMVGMATMQTRVLPQWPALPIAIGIAMFLVVAAYATLFFLPAGLANWLIMITTALAGIAWSLLGYTLWSWASRPNTALR
jgi:heme A synthase